MTRIGVYAAFTLTGVALTGGCATLGNSTISIVSEPPGAFVNIEGYGECETPCTVSLDAPRMVSIAKAGFKPQRFQIAPGAQRIRVKLELVAPTTDVEARELPAL